jgi:hypothetical protein
VRRPSTAQQIGRRGTLILRTAQGALEVRVCSQRFSAKVDYELRGSKGAGDVGQFKAGLR